MEQISLLEPYRLDMGNKYISDCLNSGWISYAGEYVSRLEEEMAFYTGAQYAVAVGSGTGGLWLSLKALGIGPGDKVIVPSMTFVATVNAVIAVGAEPVFVDCDETLNMDVDSLFNAVRYSGYDVKAIIPVHMLGNLCNMDEVYNIVNEYDGRINIIEDAAQALGTVSKNYFHAGTFGDIGMISFSFNKMVTGGGGGILLTDNETDAKRLKYLSLQAKDNAEMYIHKEAGFNMGLSNINAALACSQLEMIDEIRDKKNYIHDNYHDAFGDLIIHSDEGNNWLNAIKGVHYTSAAPKLKALDIQVRPLFYPNHLQESFTKYNSFVGDNPLKAYENTICLPSSTNMTDEQIDYVIKSLRKVMK